MKKLLLLLCILIVLLAVGQRSGAFPKLGDQLSSLNSNNSSNPSSSGKSYMIGSEENVITDVVQKALPSVVTIGIHKVTTTSSSLQFDPFNPFGGLRQVPGQQQTIQQNIGSGFIISDDGLIITNKHVVSDTEADYQILTNDKKKYEVKKIYRDPLNDLAILKIDASNLQSLSLGDSNQIKLGQLAIAIGTPLGEFTNTVTAGIVSGLGRGITAGSPYEGYVEKLDNVIQTDAAISPGNSGGPLLNSKGEVIGVNTAIAQQGQNLGFAIPANIVKSIINGFNKRGGSFETPYLGIRYKMVDKQTAVLNEVVQGAYVIEVVSDSPAAKAGLQDEDIIIQIDGTKITGSDDQTIAKLIGEKKVGDTISVVIWRNGDSLTKKIILEASK